MLEAISREEFENEICKQLTRIEEKGYFKTPKYATKEQKNEAIIKLIKLLKDNTVIVITGDDTPQSIATKAVEEACQIPYFFHIAYYTQIDAIYNRALLVIGLWLEGEYKVDRLDEEEENARIEQLEATKEKLSDCLHVPLRGTPKQVSWAESIRVEKLQELAIEVLGNRLKIDAAAKILSNSSAKWWIDNR